MRIFTCPGRGVKIKVPAERVGRFACPKCGKGLVIKAPSSGGTASPTTNQPPAAPLQSEPFPGLPAMSEFSARPVVPGPSGDYAPHTGQPRPKTVTKDTAALKSFLKRLGVGLGILAGVLVVLTGLGMIAEPIALAAAIVGALSALGLIVSGKIWLWVIAFQESVVQGLLVLLVPYYWIVYLATRKGRALKPFALIVSALVPAVLSLGMVALFAVRYDNVSRSVSGRGSGSRTLQVSHLPQASVIATPKRWEPTVPAANTANATVPVPVTTELDELRTVSFQTLAQDSIDSTRAEQVLGESSGYVPGSFRFDPGQQLVTFQYRGPQALATQYAFALQGRLFITMRLKPIFADETLPE